jgi:hypothetical protein
LRNPNSVAVTVVVVAETSGPDRPFGAEGEHAAQATASVTPASANSAYLTT